MAVETKLVKDRLDNDDVGKDVVIAHNQLEEVLTNLLGVEAGKNVSTSVLGSVQADGSIAGVIKWKASGVAADGKVGSGIEFADATSKKRLVYVNSAIQVWEADDPSDEDTDWSLVYDYEVVDEPNLTDMSDVNIGQKINGYVLAVQSMPNGDQVLVQKPNVVATDGAQDFRDLLDISQTFFFWLTGRNFATSIIGHYVGINSTKDLAPFDGAGAQSENFTARSVNKAIGRVGIDGLGTGWTVINWEAVSDGSTIALVSLTSYDGQSNAGIPLAGGIYRVNVTYRPTTFVKDGFISWKVVGAQEFPKGKWARQHNPYERYDGLSWWHPFLEPPDPHNSGGWGQQEQYIVLPNAGTVALLMGRESAETCSVYATISITRIL